MSRIEVGGKSEDMAWVQLMETSNAWLAAQADLERCLRSGWMGLAETRRLVGFAFAEATVLDDRDGVQPVLTVSQPMEGESLALSRDPDARAPLLFGALPPRPVKAAAADFAAAADAAVRLVQLQRDLRDLQLRLNCFKEAKVTDKSKEMEKEE